MPELSYCVVNTNGRDHVVACLDAIREVHPQGLTCEILVVDNASDDGSPEAIREWAATRSGTLAVALIETGRRFCSSGRRLRSASC
jgi:GT2 family glycosyltransferase